ARGLLSAFFPHLFMLLPSSLICTLSLHDALPIFRAGAGGQFASVPGVQRGFATHSCCHLFPSKVGESLGYAGTFDNRVADINIELESHGKLVVHQARGDENAL